MGEIVIGKYALESLTSGMYADPLVIYREYIQNAVDSIDNAIDNGILQQHHENVIVSIFPMEGRIEIQDNGMGLSVKEALSTLTSIGNSKKDATSARGFRGIGRLSALGYCEKLTFETTYPGEKEGTRITFDSKMLSELLTSKNEHFDITANFVMARIYTVENFQTRAADHYFNVIMEGVDKNSELLQIESVQEYISQVAPVPFNPERFCWGNEVIKRLSQFGYTIPEYNIGIQNGTNRDAIFKPYSDKFLVDKSRSTYDSIQDITVQQVLDEDKNVIAVLWRAQTGYLGTIADRTIKGLRVRKGNILIGDSQTLNLVFKDARFNGWTIGELYVLSSKLLPNARRDNFEKNSEYFSLFEKMTMVASDIVKQIRSASVKRNSELHAAIEKVDLSSENATKVLNDCQISPRQKASVSQQLRSARQQVSVTASNTPVEEIVKEIAFEELDMLIGKVQGATRYKSINLLGKLSKSEKKVLERVFNGLNCQLPKSESSKAIDAILMEFKK
ncbi:ATP-binding protein [Desulfitobacterium sp. AusDCA]|uniref:ATP-binding protein n=1 Tax=Desulfitobacterium sp. AusDCA TaxID=3240383 RepID=UPI003DA739BE